MPVAQTTQEAEVRRSLQPRISRPGNTAISHNKTTTIIIIVIQTQEILHKVIF